MEALVKILIALVKPILFRIPLWAWIVLGVVVLVWWIIDLIPPKDNSKENDND